MIRRPQGMGALTTAYFLPRQKKFLDGLNDGRWKKWRGRSPITPLREGHEVGEGGREWMPIQECPPMKPR